MFATTCPNCSKSYRIKEDSYLGRKVQCKYCNTVFVANETSIEKAIVPDADDNDGPEVDKNLPELPNYKCIRLLGYGGMGAVYEATQISLNRPVAIKFLYTKLEKDVNITRRFKQEIDILAKLDHPNIVAVLECGTSDSPLYYVMEYVKGNSLNSYIQNGMKSENVRRYALQIAAGLQHAHQHHVIHRDIKPDNVLIDQYGNAKLTDFGIAGMIDDKSHATRMTQETTQMGTLAYMSPEHKNSAAAADERSDIYSFGVMVYQMLTGRLPEGIFLMPSQIDRSLEKWDALINKCLTQEPAGRFQTMGEVITALKKSRTDVSSQVQKPQTPSDAVWSYCGSDGQWSGPYNQTQIQSHVDNFRIIRETPMLHITGSQGVAVRLSWIVFPPEKDWYYFNKKRQWQGPFDMAEVQSLADDRIIRSDTFIKKKDGQQGQAVQLTWISFPNPHPILLRFMLGVYSRIVHLLLMFFLLSILCFVLAVLGHVSGIIEIKIDKEVPYINITIPDHKISAETEKPLTDECEE